jgi:hypothetical protein
MFFWVIKQVIVSFLIIAIMHYLYNFFKTNLTIPKVKDLVNRPDEKYKEMYKAINTEIPKTEKPSNNISMKDELKDYLSDLSKKNTGPVSYSFSGSGF